MKRTRTPTAKPAYCGAERNLPIFAVGDVPESEVQREEDGFYNEKGVYCRT